MFIWIVAGVFLLILAAKSVIVVPGGNAYIVERLGRYDRTLPAGMHVLAPFLDRVAYRYSLLPAEQAITDQCITRDNVPVRVSSVVRAQILDPKESAYATADASEALITLVRSRQRMWIEGKSWDDARGSTRELESAVMSAASEAAEKMGIALLALDVKSVERVESA